MWYGTGTKYRRNHRFFLEPPHLQAYDESPVDLWDIRHWSGLSQWGKISLKLRCISGHWIEMEKHLKLEWSIKKPKRKTHKRLCKGAHIDEFLFVSGNWASSCWKILQRLPWAVRQEAEPTRLWTIPWTFFKPGNSAFIFLMKFYLIFNLDKDMHVLLLQRKKIITNLSAPEWAPLTPLTLGI